jgi:CRP-like cAMP-binding protein
MPEWTGYLAAILVFVTFYMRTMQPLRVMAIASNVAFLAYAIPFHLWPIVILHGLLLPLNAMRLIQLRRMLARLRLARVQELDVLKLLPHLAHEDRLPGAVVFRRGDPSDGAYFIGSGEVEIPELGLRLQAGQFFGEGGVFSSARVRTASAVCVAAARLYRISDHDLAMTFHRDPALAFALIRLIADRMGENAARAAAALAGGSDAPAGDAAAI